MGQDAIWTWDLLSHQHERLEFQLYHSPARQSSPRRGEALDLSKVLHL